MDETTMACNRISDVHRLHDDELPLALRESEQAHIRECAECREILAELPRVSSLIVAAPRQQMPAEMSGRIHRSWREAADRSVLRIAGWLTAAAAAVLIAALLAWPGDRGEGEPRPAVWETIAVLPPADEHDETGSNLVVLAQWMADDLSSSQER